MDDLTWSLIGLVTMAGLIVGIAWLCPRSRTVSEEDRQRARFLLAKAYDQYRKEVSKEAYRQQLLEHGHWPAMVTLADMSDYTDLVSKLEQIAGVMDPTKVQDWVEAAGVSDEMKWGRLLIWVNEVSLRVYFAQAVNRVAAEGLEPAEALQQLRQDLNFPSGKTA